MREDEFKNALADFRLLNKSVFTMPIFLKAYSNFKLGQIKSLIYKGKKLLRLKLPLYIKSQKNKFVICMFVKTKLIRVLKKSLKKVFSGVEVNLYLLSKFCWKIFFIKLY